MQSIVHAFGAGVGSNILFFPLTYFALKKQLGLAFSWWQIAFLFFVCSLIIGVTQQLMGGGQLSYMEVVSTLLVPMLVDAIVISVAQRVIGKKKSGPSNNP
ncbi:MAG: hypothetical protein NTV11_16100 [Rhodocyclales bacterium]|nr:hypothetical protein [Rhodocyclales bacterium]